MKWAQITDRGLAREVNEDSLLVDRELGLMAIADGMGGHLGGRIASNLALRILEQELARTLQQQGDLQKCLLGAVKIANSAVYARSCESEDLKGMGTTITAGLYRDEQLVIAHVGDSRAYLQRRDEFRQLTLDHSLVQELVRQGGISQEQAMSHPQRHMLTRALGTDPFVEVDIYLERMQPGDQLLLCTDGLTRYLQQTELLEVLRSTMDPDRIVQTLLGRALQAGGADNITIVLACF